MTTTDATNTHRCPSCGRFLHPEHTLCAHCTRQQARISQQAERERRLLAGLYDAGKVNLP